MMRSGWTRPRPGALAFVACRLDAESVGLLFGTRDPAGEGDLAGLPGLAVEGLPEAFGGSPPS